MKTPPRGAERIFSSDEPENQTKLAKRLRTSVRAAPGAIVFAGKAGLLPMGRQRLPSIIQNFRAAEISSSQGVDPAEQVFFTRHTGDLIAQQPVLEEEQRWDGANVVL